VDIKAYIESGIIESYVLGLASSEEAAEVEMLMTQHNDIKNAVDEFAGLIERQAFADAVIPPGSTKENLIATLSNEFVESGKKYDAFVVPLHTDDIAIRDTRVKRFSQLKYFVAASIILLIASIGLNFYLYSNYKNASSKYQSLLLERNSLQANNDAFQTKLNELEESMRIIQNPDMKVITLKGQPGRENNLAAVYWDTKTKDVYLLPTRMDAAPSGKQYQLWAIVNGKAVDAGVVGHCNGVCKMKNIPNAQAFAITLEKEGGSPTPTLTEMYVSGQI
jgi:anti-sigma-K factor RskA